MRFIPVSISDLKVRMVSPPSVKTRIVAFLASSPPPAPPPPPPPEKPKVAEKASPKGDPGSWATTDDYPPSSLRNEEAGTTGFRLEIGTDGKATSCSITKSSGFSALDDATCKVVSRRARFKPAKDASGTPIGDTYSSRVKWQIPN